VHILERLLLTKRANLIAANSLSVFVCILACVGMGKLLTTLGKENSQVPVRSLKATMDRNQSQELFDQLHRFADKHAFAYNLTDYGGQGEHFLVYIRGDKIKILTVEASRNLNVFSIRFYAPSPGDPVPAEQMVNDLLADLKDFLSEIPNARVIEEE
jgi:hypothetical protein